MLELNPELILLAARKAYRNTTWTEDCGRIVDEHAYEFDITDLGDQIALQIVLELDWKFTRGKHGFEAEKKDGSVILYELTKPALLLAIVEHGEGLGE